MLLVNHLERIPRLNVGGAMNRINSLLINLNDLYGRAIPGVLIVPLRCSMTPSIALIE
jgi:hypothetical protein